MEGGLAENQIEQAGVIRLNGEEEKFLGRYAEERGANYGIGWIAPYPGMDEV